MLCENLELVTHKHEGKKKAPDLNQKKRIRYGRADIFYMGHNIGESRVFEELKMKQRKLGRRFLRSWEKRRGFQTGGLTSWRPPGWRKEGKRPLPTGSIPVDEKDEERKFCWSGFWCFMLGVLQVVRVVALCIFSVFSSGGVSFCHCVSLR